MKYIDVHIHLGDCGVFDLDISEEQVMSALERDHIDAAIVQPCPGAKDPIAVHDQVYSMTQKYPGKIYGLACFDPHLPAEIYKERVRHYVQDLGFLGIKMHTLGNAINPLSKDAEKMYEIAGELDIPIMVHTGIGVPFAMPSLLLPVTKKYPGIDFVIAHSGGQVYASEALILAQERDNVYLDATWVEVDVIGLFVKELGSKRLLFAGDALNNIAVELKKYEMLCLSESEYEDIFYKNAISIFKIKGF